MKKSLQFIFFSISVFLIHAFLLDASMAEGTDWRECPKITIKDMAEAVLGERDVTKGRNVCYEAGKLSVILDERFKGELVLFGKRYFKTSPIFSTDDTGILRLFRKTELFLLDRLGSPYYFHKQGSSISDSTMLLLYIKNGKIEYRSVWKIKGRSLTLLLSGGKSAVNLSLGWD